MLFLKRGLPLSDMKMPAAAQPIATPRFRAPLQLPLSLFEEVPATEMQSETPVSKGEMLYLDETKLPTVCTASGVVSGLAKIQHPLYGALTCACIRQEEGEEQLLSVSADVNKLTVADLVELSRAAGIIDETDGTPLFEKLASFEKGGFVVVDATEPQPFASSAFCVLKECKDAVLGGLQMLKKAFSAVGGHIALCLTNPAMKAEINKLYTADCLFFAPLRYPVSVYAQTAAPLYTVGVQAVCALYEAVYAQKAATHTVITVAGDAVKTPQNIRVAFGTPIQSLLDYCGMNGTPVAIIGGDAINGVPLMDTTLPVLPGMTCLLVLGAVPAVQNDPCIGCGRCAQVCHKNLLPYEISRRLENMHYERLAHLHAQACDGCGACSFVCPSKRDVAGAVLNAAQSDGAVFLDWGGNEDG